MLDRRGALTMAIACAAVRVVPAAAAAPSGATGCLMAIRRTRLWVEDIGPRDAPPLVYVHGGPGVGALEFETYMAPALAGRVRLISVDQRGALRSDPVAVGATVTVADLVADLDAVRTALGIGRWQVLGHSFGGTIALRYALAHPVRVARLILENPALDAAASGRWLAAAMAQMLNGRDPAAAVEANRLAITPTVDKAFYDRLGAVGAKLGARRQDLYVAQPRHRDIFSRLAATAGLPDARWKQGEAAGMAVLRAADLYAPMLGRVAEVRAPILYVRGSGDHVTSPDEIAALLAAGARMTTVPDAGHFVHVEAPKALGDLLAG